MLDDELVLDTWIDGNGCFTERKRIGGQEVVVHYDDLPDSDVTVIGGIPVTTIVRTLIDCAPEMERDEFVAMLRSSLDRRLFQPVEAYARIAEPDMQGRAGTKTLGEELDRLGFGGQRTS